MQGKRQRREGSNGANGKKRINEPKEEGREAKRKKRQRDEVRLSICINYNCHRMKELRSACNWSFAGLIIETNFKLNSLISLWTFTNQLNGFRNFHSLQSALFPHSIPSSVGIPPFPFEGCQDLMALQFASCLHPAATHDTNWINQRQQFEWKTLSFHSSTIDFFISTS